LPSASVYSIAVVYWLETVKLVDGTDFFNHVPRRSDFAGAAIDQPAWQARLEFVRFFRLVRHLVSHDFIDFGAVVAVALASGKR